METKNNSFSLRKFLSNLFTISFSCTTKKNTGDIVINVEIVPKVDETIVIENEVSEVIEVISEIINIELEVTETHVVEK